MNISEANAANTILVWAMATATGRHPIKNGVLITDDMATKAAKLLAERASKALMAGLRPEEVELRSADVTKRAATIEDGVIKGTIAPENVVCADLIGYLIVTRNQASTAAEITWSGELHSTAAEALSELELARNQAATQGQRDRHLIAAVTELREHAAPAGISATFTPDEIEALVRTAADAVYGDHADLSASQLELAGRARSRKTASLAAE